MQLRRRPWTKSQIQHLNANALIKNINHFFYSHPQTGRDISLDYVFFSPLQLLPLKIFNYFYNIYRLLVRGDSKSPIQVYL